MKKITIYLSPSFKMISIILVLVSNISMAQEFRVISCSGEAFHMYNANSTATPLIPGNKIDIKGMLILKEDAVVKIISKDAPIVFDKPGVFELMPVYQESQRQSMSFTGRFWKFVMDGLKNSDTDQDLKKYHKNYLSVSGGIRGYSGVNGAIKIISPLAGKITETKLEIDYKSEKALQSLQVVDALSRTVLLERTKTLASPITISAMDFKDDSIESYLIILADDQNQIELEIQCQNINEQKVKNKLSSLVDYQDADDQEQMWMRAIVLEMEDYNSAAKNLYKKLLVSYPDDQLIQKLYKLFLARNS